MSTHPERIRTKQPIQGYIGDIHGSNVIADAVRRVELQKVSQSAGNQDSQKASKRQCKNAKP